MSGPLTQSSCHIEDYDISAEMVLLRGGPPSDHLCTICMQSCTRVEQIPANENVRKIQKVPGEVITVLSS